MTVIFYVIACVH